MGMQKNIENKGELKERMEKNAGPPQVLYFDNGLSRICRIVRRMVEKDKNLMTMANFYVLDVNNKDFENEATTYRVETYPTFVLLKNGQLGQEKTKYVGFDIGMLRKTINDALSTPN